ncbi:hypothetical protein [Streptomyces shenzhenensis]|uniref:hypothetical protein n=1 Tax=Streptomyces shenzhenensis TaxID=943815 RepID=UPI001604EA45|nr:hypothetical protein [Streptomyces shenzhenensis]
MTEPIPEESAPADPIDTCPSAFPRNPSITCQLVKDHNARMIHRRETGGPDSPYFEWE